MVRTAKYVRPAFITYYYYTRRSAGKIRSGVTVSSARNTCNGLGDDDGAETKSTFLGDGFPAKSTDFIGETFVRHHHHRQTAPQTFRRRAVCGAPVVPAKSIRRASRKTVISDAFVGRARTVIIILMNH